MAVVGIAGGGGMNAGLVRQALRRNPWAFLGPAATQALAAALVTIGLTMVASLDAAPPSGRR
jgi:hypothetical protein